MININSNKGITIAVLIVTVILLLILFGTTIYNIKLPRGLEQYNNMIADIELLKDRVIIYFNKYGKIPVTNRKLEVEGTEYKEIDLKKLDNVTLNYGNEYGQQGDLKEDSAVYVIDQSLNIYYLKGVQKDGEMYHR